jgi:hypothetical protein
MGRPAGRGHHAGRLQDELINSAAYPCSSSICRTWNHVDPQPVVGAAGVAPVGPALPLVSEAFASQSQSRHSLPAIQAEATGASGRRVPYRSNRSCDGSCRVCARPPAMDGGGCRPRQGRCAGGLPSGGTWDILAISLQSRIGRERGRLWVVCGLRVSRSDGWHGRRAWLSRVL